MHTASPDTASPDSTDTLSDEDLLEYHYRSGLAGGTWRAPARARSARTR